MRYKVIIFLLVISLIGNCYAISNSIKHKRVIEYHQSDRLYKELYVSTLLLQNICKDLTMPEINTTRLKNYSDILRQFTYVHTTFNDFTEITDKLFEFITKLETDNMTVETANKIGQKLYDRSQVLLQNITTYPDKNNENINDTYEEILFILKEF